MIGTHRIGKNALPRMIGVRALGREQFLGLAARAGLGFCARDLQQGKIIDRAGPGQLKIIEGRVSAGRRKLRERSRKKSHVPQRRSDESAPRDAALHPAVFEVLAGEELRSRSGAGKKSGDAAGKALAKLTPGDVEFWLDDRGKANGSETSGGR
jgi:hypothetical protein